MQVRKTNYEVNATPKFQVLSEEEIDQIVEYVYTL